MEVPEPKRKKHCRLAPDLPLPIVLRKDGSVKKFQGSFNGFTVVVNDIEDAKALISKGYFGKANFSRSYPQLIKPGVTNIIRKRQFDHRRELTKNCKVQRPEKVITVPDSDSDTEDFFTNLQPKSEIDYSGLKETVWLGFEEAFFLASVVKCLNISWNSNTLQIPELWKLFEETDPNFIKNYVVYYYYRAKNWVVKPGIKFGGDFMLYKQGPPFYHSTYVIIIEIVDKDNQTIQHLTNHSMDNLSVLSLNRLCETSGKELLICRVKWPENNSINYEDFTNIEIKEILVQRWIASQEREDPT